MMLVESAANPVLLLSLGSLFKFVFHEAYEEFLQNFSFVFSNWKRPLTSGWIGATRCMDPSSIVCMLWVNMPFGHDASVIANTCKICTTVLHSYENSDK